jgi:hypothetical protein
MKQKAGSEGKCKQYGMSTAGVQQWLPVIDISQYRLLFGFSLLYTDRVPFELLDRAALLVRRAAVEGAK